MAGPEDKRPPGQEDEDLFEDLDEFFAPLEETEWPGEGTTPPEPESPSGSSAEGPAEEWDLEIDLPDEAELLAEEAESPAGAEPSAAPGGEPEPQPTVTVDDEAPALGEGGPGEPEGEGDWDEMRAEALASTGERAGDPDAEAEARIENDVTEAEGELPDGEPEAVGPDEVEAEEAILAAEDLFEAAPSAPGRVDAIGASEEAEPPAEDRPEAEVVEAAADHFATGLRDSPEDVERELLSDLDAPADVTVTIESAPPPTATPPPTWQEGSEPLDEAAEEPAEQPRAPLPGGRNLVAAAASGIVLAVAVIVLLVIDKGPFAVFASIVILLGQAELYAVMRTRRLQPATLLGLVCGALILAGAYLRGPAAVLFGLVLATGLTVLWYMAAPGNARRNTTVNVGATVLGVAYVPMLASFALLLLAFPGDLGRNTFLVVLGLTVLYDVIAYAVGSLWGNRPLAPTISPNKSWEGVIGATLGVLIVALAIVPAVEPFTSSRAVGLALVIALAAPLGDLVESALKRDLGVKDMGTILPGHGGILDRIDAILFTAPAAYYFLQISF
jgi:phosphatidate cytidylyltransferase